MRFMQAPLLRGALGVVSGLLAGFVVSLPIVIAAHDLLPVMSILYPFQNQQVGGYVTVFNRADSAGVVGLRFQIDGQDLGSEITSGSCKAIWDSTQKTDGLHTIQAIGRDQYGNLTLAQPVTVLVSNPPFPPPVPTPTPSPGPTPTPSAAEPVEMRTVESIPGAPSEVEVQAPAPAVEPTVERVVEPVRPLFGPPVQK